MSADGARILCPNYNFNLSSIQFDISVFDMCDNGFSKNHGCLQKQDSDYDN